MKKETSIEIASKGNSGLANIETKPNVGMLILYGFLTAGISPIVDLATKSYFIPKTSYTKYVDAQAAINNTEPRTSNELRQYLLGLEWESLRGK